MNCNGTFNHSFLFFFKYKLERSAHYIWNSCGRWIHSDSQPGPRCSWRRPRWRPRWGSSYWWGLGPRRQPRPPSSREPGEKSPRYQGLPAKEPPASASLPRAANPRASLSSPLSLNTHWEATVWQISSGAVWSMISFITSPTHCLTRSFPHQFD